MPITLRGPHALYNAHVLLAESTFMRYDEMDRKILACLREDGRASFAEMAARLPLSAPAIKRRVDRLVESGAIRGFSARIDPQLLGWTTEAFVELHCRNHTAPAEIAQMLSKHPEVVAAYTISGDADALLHLRAADIPAMEAAIERIRTHPNAARTNSRIVLSRLLDRQD